VRTAKQHEGDGTADGGSVTSTGQTPTQV
jgi:hypothetical protein